MEIKYLKDRINCLKNADKIEKIIKGYSPDQKYIVHLTNGKKYLLRTSEEGDSKKKHIEFQTLAIMQQYNVRSSKPIDIGFLEDLKICYIILSFIEGEDAETALAHCSRKEQYQIGLEAGEDLYRMHAYVAPTNIESWYTRAMKKHYKYLEAYNRCSIKIKHDDRIINFIEGNKQYIRNRPNKFQHDDFHVGNVIIENSGYAGIIDFNGFDWGDPIHDFVKLSTFGRKVSIPFSMGQIMGYFHHNRVDHFWNLYAIYAAMNIFSSIVWSINSAPEQLDEMLERLYLVLEDHKYFERVEPAWYESLHIGDPG